MQDVTVTDNMITYEKCFPPMLIKKKKKNEMAKYNLHISKNGHIVLYATRLLL